MAVLIENNLQIIDKKKKKIAFKNVRDSNHCGRYYDAIILSGVQTIKYTACSNGTATRKISDR